MNECFVFLASDDQDVLTSGNTYNDFTLTLPRPLELERRSESGALLHWTVALTEIYVEHQDYEQLDSCDIAVLCNAVVDSYIANTYSPVLRTFPRGE